LQRIFITSRRKFFFTRSSKGYLIIKKYDRLMKRTLIILTILLLAASHSSAQVTDKMITSWWFNTTNATYAGTNGTVLVNVEAVYYTSSLVYVKSSGVPSYYTDSQSKFNAKDQTNVFKLPRTQTVGTSATRTYLRDEGAVAVLIDGSVALSPCDGKSYNSAGVWHQLAYKFEGGDFDSYKGHSTPGGQYHHHVDPSPLYTVSASSVHSPIIGYAFDGYPIYGPYGYTNVNGTGAIKRMTASWGLRNITTRTTLPDGSTAASSGPALAAQSLGKYFEDYTYTSGSGDLDQYNGRTCVTPEYPSGTYCYFLTLDASLAPTFPYIIGDYMYGVVQSGNMGPTGGNNTVPANATLYASVMPVELTKFTAQANECSIDISWASQMETRFKQYELESSTDGKTFRPLSIEAAKGDKSSYSVRDNATEGVHYYRLKMVDWDGQYQYSGVVSASSSCVFKQLPIKIYPNPVVNEVTIELSDNQLYKINVYNATGVLLKTINDATTTRIDMSGWASGAYVIEIVDAPKGNGYMQRVIKQ
jgi:YHYH protein/Secretion system C-terminal sorting domain